MFFISVTAVYFMISSKLKCYWLLLASYYFYMCWNLKYAILMLAATVSSYLCARAMNRAGKLILCCGILFNVLLLIWFKYFDFLLEIFNALLGIMFDNIQPVGYIDILLPVGISFYIFQVIGYMVDVYRGQEVERDFFRYALFVAFYPQLVAGPIERSKNILGAFEGIGSGKIKFEYERMTNGLIMMLYGLFMKIVIADRLVSFVDKVFASYMEINGVYLLIAAFAFAMQIYCDFAGYSFIAIGAAQVYGIALMENFSTPYFSRSISEFWRKWHISLSAWFRDYVYIPLGGNRCSEARNCFNIISTFLISGLWHGAAWNYIMWGGVHGIAQIIEKRMANVKVCKIMKVECFSYKLLKTCITFAIVVIAWIFFRADSPEDAYGYIYHMFDTLFAAPFDFNTLFGLGMSQTEWRILIIAISVLFCIDKVRFKYGMRLDIYLETQNSWFKWMVCIFLFCFTLIFGIYGPGSTDTAFIYFQF